MHHFKAAPAPGKNFDAASAPTIVPSFFKYFSESGLEAEQLKPELHHFAALAPSKSVLPSRSCIIW
jgi:hypothetical protein